MHAIKDFKRFAHSFARLQPLPARSLYSFPNDYHLIPSLQQFPSASLMRNTGLKGFVPFRVRNQSFICDNGLLKYMTKDETISYESSSDLRKNKDVDRWYNNVTQGSQKTADVYLRRLKAFCMDVQKSPLELIKMDEESLYYLLLDFVSSEQKRNVTGSYIHSSVKAVKSWLKFKRIFIRGEIKIKGANQTPTIEDEVIPTKEELKRIFLNATPRDRVVCALMAHSGLRPGVIGDGNDGLQVRDFPELQIENETVTFTEIPTMIRVRENLSKAGHKYFTFLSEEGCEFLKEYLESRLRTGEILLKDADIVSPKSVKKKFLSTVKVRDCARNSLRKVGLEKRPYVLRSFFSTQFQIAESEGKMTSSYRKFFFGHKGDMEARYSTHKGRLPEDMIESMRDTYRKSQPYLETRRSEVSKEDIKPTIKREMLLAEGLEEDDIDGLDLSKNYREILKEMEEKRSAGRHSNNASYTQKVVPLDDIERYIVEGYEYVTTLPGERGIVRLLL